MGHCPSSSADGAEGGDGSGGEERKCSGFGGGGSSDRQGEGRAGAIGERDWASGAEGRSCFRAAVELRACEVECSSGDVEQADSTTSGTVEECHAGGHSKEIVDGDVNAIERETEPGGGGGDGGSGIQGERIGTACSAEVEQEEGVGFCERRNQECEGEHKGLIDETHGTSFQVPIFVLGA